MTTPTGTGKIVNYPAPTVTDAVTDGITAVCNPPSGDFFNVGATTVTCTAEDDAGNVAQKIFTVTVVRRQTARFL